MKQRSKVTLSSLYIMGLDSKKIAYGSHHVDILKLVLLPLAMVAKDVAM